MQTVIKADDGDLITVHADDLSIEQLTVRLEPLLRKPRRI